jgi:hypothetical protein
MLKASETGSIAPEELALARRDLSEAQHAQEFECSFDAAVVVAYYGALMRQAEADGRVTGVPYDPAALVWTAWDLGIRDATAIWFAQMVGREASVMPLRPRPASTSSRLLPVPSSLACASCGTMWPA